MCCGVAVRPAVSVGRRPGGATFAISSRVKRFQADPCGCITESETRDTSVTSVRGQKQKPSNPAGARGGNYSLTGFALVPSFRGAMDQGDQETEQAAAQQIPQQQRMRTSRMSSVERISVYDDNSNHA